MPPLQSPYERDIYLFLTLCRFLSFALAVGLMVTVPKQPLTDLRMLLIVSLTGVYSILKVVFRFRLWQRDSATYTVLGADLALCLTLVLITGGADSPFLLYSLLPIITAALFFEPPLAILIAAITAANLILAQTVFTLLSSHFIPILQGNYLTVVLIYTTFCFFIATITYRTNLNIYRHIQSAAIAEERRQLRREMHDGIAQVMGLLKTKIDLLKNSLSSSDEKILAEVEEIHKVASDSYEDVREAIDSLNNIAESVSLLTALASSAEQLGKRTGGKVEFTAPRELPGLYPLAQLQLLRIAQEALNNVRKHASATQIWVRLDNTPQGMELVVKDNGRGFSPSSEQKGTGLTIMKERAISINGVLTVTSSPGQGTEVRVIVPRA